MWDVDADVMKLTKEFFEGYFGEAAKPMMKYYESFRSWSAYLRSEMKLSGHMYFDFYNKNHYPKQVLNAWLEDIDAAYNAIEKLQTLDPTRYTLLYDRICAESIAVRYYLADFHSASYKSSQLNEMRESFKKDATRLGFRVFGENKGIQETLFNKWGLAV